MSGTYEWRGKPGEKYRPSNGTEGVGFMEIFCMECERDRLFWAEEGDGCAIAARSMAFDVEDEMYPVEWTYDAEGRPVCTAFVPLGDRLPTDRELEADGQQTLFDAYVARRAGAS